MQDFICTSSTFRNQMDIQMHLQAFTILSFYCLTYLAGVFIWCLLICSDEKLQKVKVKVKMHEFDALGSA